MKKFLKKVFVISLICCSTVSIVAYGKNENGNMEGSGMGASIDFDLNTSNPTNGEENISLNSKIILDFNKNVVNILVKDNNKQCFKLKDDSGHSIPIDITMADDQVERDKRREIILIPKNILKKGKKYKVEISPRLQAKNGSSLDKVRTLNFTTIKDKSTVIKNEKVNTSKEKIVKKKNPLKGENLNKVQKDKNNKLENKKIKEVNKDVKLVKEDQNKDLKNKELSNKDSKVHEDSSKSNIKVDNVAQKKVSSNKDGKKHNILIEVLGFIGVIIVGIYFRKKIK